MTPRDDRPFGGSVLAAVGVLVVVVVAVVVVASWVFLASGVLTWQ